MSPTHSYAKRQPVLVSFSGMDGAGKSTQIKNLRSCLEGAGVRVVERAFWDDVVVGTRFRESFSHAVLKSEKGIGAPGRPVARRDKNVRSWYLNLSRYAMYFADALNLGRVVRGVRREQPDVIIFDRYIYDQLANLPLHNLATRVYIGLVKRVIPRPDVIFFLDADPAAARERKPEYPVDFLEQNRRAYLQLAGLVGGVTIVPAQPLQDVLCRVVNDFARAFPGIGKQSSPSTLVSENHSDTLHSAPAA